MSEFQIGDKVVYPGRGVAEIVGIDNKEINATLCAFYVLKVLGSDLQVMVPRDKADQVGLRPVASTEEIEEVFELLKDPDVRIDKQTWNRRSRGFLEKIRTGSLFDVAEVFRDLYRLKSTKPLSFGEKELLEKVRTLMVREMATARQCPESAVVTDIEKAFA